MGNCRYDVKLWLLYADGLPSLDHLDLHGLTIPLKRKYEYGLLFYRVSVVFGKAKAYLEVMDCSRLQIGGYVEP